MVAFADELRAAGHTVHTPDLFDGRTFDSLDEGWRTCGRPGSGRSPRVACVRPTVFPARSSTSASHSGRCLLQELAQTRAGARGALLLHACIPVSEFGTAWPEGVPVQVHAMEDDPFFAEDAEAARALVAGASDAELFLYPGEQHLFADSSLPSYDPDAAKLLTRRTLEFLDAVDRAAANPR